MLDRPWIRALLGVLAAAALGAVAARVVGAGSAGGGAPAGMASGSGSGSSGSYGGSGGSGSGGGSGSSSGRSGGSSGGDGGGVALTSGGGRITVHVAGAVRRPGVYRLAEGDRVFQAVRRAGGTAPRADRQGLNLAAPLRDGQQVLVPSRAPAGGGGGRSYGSADGEDAPIDLNSADEEELQKLDGVGPTTAAKIVALREQRGGLGGVDDLDEVPGIGPKTLETLRGQLGG